uniref:Uncharacterized protein n=2 Tax=Tetraselmis sp. GSL018 TaxID=582737 RepID=A0A061QL31_9CHLO
MHNSPGPFDYTTCKQQQCEGGPKYSLQGKTTEKEPSHAPGPGDYTAGPRKEGAEYSIRGKLSHGSPWAVALRHAREGAPGPGSYEDVKPFPRPLGSVVSSMMKKPTKKSS